MSDYKQRMIREHRELQERISKLAHMLEGYAEGTLDFTAACSFQLLESQLYAMGTYANILQERARIEQVDLNAPLEGGESGEVPQDQPMPQMRGQGQGEMGASGPTVCPLVLASDFPVRALPAAVPHVMGHCAIQRQLLSECNPLLERDVQRRPEIQADSRESGRQTMSTLDILGNTSEQADSIRLMLKVRGMKDGRFIDADPLIILKADNHKGSDRWDVYVSKTVYPTAESYGTLAGILRMLANDVEIMAHEKEMGGRR